MIPTDRALTENTKRPSNRLVGHLVVLGSKARHLCLRLTAHPDRRRVAQTLGVLQGR